MAVWLPATSWWSRKCATTVAATEARNAEAVSTMSARATARRDGDSSAAEVDPTRRPAITAALVVSLVVAAAGVLGWLVIEPPPPTFPPASRSPGAHSGVPVATGGNVTDPVMGSWSARNGTIVADALPADQMTSVSDEGLVVALAPLETTDGFIVAKANPVAPGWGLTFRWTDPDNHGWLRVAPAYAAAKVGVTIQGISTDLATFSPVAIDGSTFEVDVVDDEILVWTGGRLVGRVRGIPPQLGDGWGVMGDARTIGVAGWAGARAGTIRGDWLDDRTESRDGDDGANR